MIRASYLIQYKLLLNALHKSRSPRLKPMLITGICGFLLLTCTALSGLALSAEVAADIDERKPAADCDQLRQFTFSWQFVDRCGMKPRGGTSTGGNLELDPKPSRAWELLQDQKLSKQERDRRAILAMAGPYRASFDFLEIVGYHPDFKPDPPYQSWGTEYIYVVADEKDFISLQHIMVMYYQNPQGETVGPMVQKHWRQDWHYEQDDILVYGGNNIWRHERFESDAVAGTWTQSVYQVDDSPRYAAKGRWEHTGNVSTWLSDMTWRPLPRRESSFRDDYDVLIGRNRHTITPYGWLHEEENYKAVLDEEAKLAGATPYLSKELGVNRYERLINFDFSAGDKYWESTKAYWGDVRKAWSELEAQGKPLLIRERVNEVPLFMPFFEYAERIAQTQAYDAEAGRIAIDKILRDYVEMPRPIPVDAN